MVAITGQLQDWQDVCDGPGEWRTLLMGNGVSVNLWGGFSYPRLFAKASLGQPAIDVFASLGTSNFEAVLEGLWHAETVLAALGESTAKVDSLYQEVRDGLFRAVRTTHVPWSKVPGGSLDQIAQALDEFRQVFTLNYDLIPYWALMNDPAIRIADFFWGAGHSFDPDMTDVHAGFTALYFLHGGVHLWQNMITGVVGKWTNQGGDLLSSIEGRYNQTTDRQPLFVSEGTTEHKRRTIRRAEYLAFALAALRDDSDDTVIIGSSLSAQDDHVVSALVHGSRRRIAVGQRPGSPKALAAAQGALASRLDPHKISFFDVETHPLCDPGLHIP